MRKPILVLMAALLLSGAAGAADHNRARDAVRQQQILPLGEGLAAVQGRYPGRVMDVQLDSGRWVYLVKLLTQGGRVQVIAVDARTARILSVQGPR